MAPPTGRRAQQPEGVWREPAGGRGEGAEQRLVIERVGDRRQQRADVGDLLLGPVAAAADDVGPQSGPLQGVLIGVEVGEGAQQHDDLAARYPGVGQLAQRPARKRASARQLSGVRPSVSAARSSPSQPSRALSSSSTAGPLGATRRLRRRGADPQRAIGVAEAAPRPKR